MPPEGVAGPGGTLSSRLFESEALGLRIALPEGWEFRTGSGPVLVTARSGSKEVRVVATRREERPGAAGLAEEDVAGLWSSFLADLPGADPGAPPSGRGDLALGGEAGRFAWILVPAAGSVPARMGYCAMVARGGLLVRVGLVAPQSEYRAARQAFDAAAKSLHFTR